MNIDEVPRYLLQHKILLPEHVLQGRVAVDLVKRRNFNFRVTSTLTAGLFVKQAFGNPSNDFSTVASESAFYSLVQNEPRLQEVQPFIPQIIKYDRDCQLLVTSLIDGTPLWQNHLLSEPPPLSATDSFLIGASLGKLHLLLRNYIASGSVEQFSTTLPWALRSQYILPEALAFLSLGNVAVLRFIQSHFSEFLLEAATRWCPDTIIHGDIKGDNILISTSRRRIYFTDWEFVQIGDAAWDAAGFIHEFVNLWVSSMHSRSDDLSDEAILGLAYDFPFLYPCISSAMNGYLSVAGLSRPQERAFVERVVRFSAVRMIQTAYEQSAKRREISSSSRLLLQISCNILRDPARALTEFYGVSEYAW
jgi:Ser/Thr protein kinase RdoA (MazF antagonist)